MQANISTIELVRDVELEILDVIHTICIEHNLTYSLGYGSLLGLVRHGGFIPWDDDIDIIMPRRDYDKLLALWKEVAPDNFILQVPGLQPDLTNNFAKICKDHTTYLQCEADRTKAFHKGIFVDIFPADHAAPNTWSRTVQFCFQAINLLFSRGYPSPTGHLIGLCERILLRLPKKFHAPLGNWATKESQKWNSHACGGYIFPCTIRSCKKTYPPNLFQNVIAVPFHGRQYLAIVESDAFLRTEYGDYMQLPPEEERTWKHHPILIDFEHNYEELPPQQHQRSQL